MPRAAWLCSHANFLFSSLVVRLSFPATTGTPLEMPWSHAKCLQVQGTLDRPPLKAVLRHVEVPALGLRAETGHHQGRAAIRGGLRAAALHEDVGHEVRHVSCHDLKQKRAYRRSIPFPQHPSSPVPALWRSVATLSRKLRDPRIRTSPAESLKVSTTPSLRPFALQLIMEFHRIGRVGQLRLVVTLPWTAAEPHRLAL